MNYQDLNVLEKTNVLLFRRDLVRQFHKDKKCGSTFKWITRFLFRGTPDDTEDDRLALLKSIAIKLFRKRPWRDIPDDMRGQ